MMKNSGYKMNMMMKEIMQRDKGDKGDKRGM
jgi:hypothetical protein